MLYTEEQIINLAGDDIINSDTFYLSETVSKAGETTDSCKQYREVVAEFLLINKFIQKDNFTQVKQITKNDSYCTNNSYSSQNSELTKIYEKYGLSNKLGLIIDISIPLSNYENDQAGVVDILTYKKETNELFVVQIKSYNSNDTLLKAVLEIQTFYQTMDKEKLVADYYSAEKINTKNPEIKKALVLEKGATAYNEYNWEMNNVYKIIEDLEIDIVACEV